MLKPGTLIKRIKSRYYNSFAHHEAEIGQIAMIIKFIEYNSIAGNLYTVFCNNQIQINWGSNYFEVLEEQE